ncbi:ATP-grasp domain-containing protein [Fodinisporobacter ferrooxydans]|uniref:ATP-grasp domain-containing protein n=1 Tax=Fodinisporobacter ferrooxydans TaxID=2901836 RepID=A0ABY4CEX9_9BACL|nr:ATP-grasp domain-containing protein [Alicyclobacillaceae bacterium MYW30-H2]
MKEWNILFTSAGRRVSLVKNFKETLTKLNVVGKIITADCKENAPAAFVADIHELVPSVTDNHYIDHLKRICVDHNIRLIIPLIDTELLRLALHKKEFAEMGVTVLVSSPEVNEICFDKRKTGEFFRRIGVQTPEIYDAEEILSTGAANYPYLMKPAYGSGSIGVTKINNAKELSFFKDYIPNAIVQEFIMGHEYTLDIFVDFDSNVQTVVPRLRMETRAGEVSKGITVKNQELIHAGKKVAGALPGAVGCVTVQCFVTPKNEIKFIEINPRFGGGVPLSIAAGADFPLWIMKMMSGEKLNPAMDDWKDGVVMLRYDEAIFMNQDLVC